MSTSLHSALWDRSQTPLLVVEEGLAALKLPYQSRSKSKFSKDENIPGEFVTFKVDVGVPPNRFSNASPTDFDGWANDLSAEN